MNGKELDYGGLALLSVEVPPSRYLFARNGIPRMIGWQIALAGGAVRDVLFSELDGAHRPASIGSSLRFHVRTMPLAGFAAIPFDDLPFAVEEEDGRSMVFVPENRNSLPCLPRITYGLSELYFRVEISIANGDSMPLYWRPEIHFFINLPWVEGIPLEKFVLRSVARRRLRLGGNWNVIGTAKAAEKMSLDGLKDGPMGLAQLQDNKIWLGTPNEEEGLSFIFGNKTARSVFVIGKADGDEKVEVAFLSSPPTEDAEEISNGDVCGYVAVAPGGTDSFAAELSAY
jgi:hypothetical protein